MSDSTISQAPQTFADLLAQSMGQGAEDPFLGWEEQWMSFGAFHQAAHRFAGWLRSEGLVPGETMALLMNNRPEFLIAVYGAWVAGVVVVPINTQLSAEEISWVAQHAECRILVTEGDLLPIVRQLDLPATHQGTLIVPAEGTAEAWIAELGPEIPAEAVEINPEALASIQYTSGTTAFPKGVLHSHRSLLNAGLARAKHMGYGVGDTMLVVTPLFHLNAQLVGIMALGKHFRLALRPKFSASRFWSDVRRDHITSMHGLQTIPRILMSREPVGAERNHPLKTMVAVLGKDLHRAFEKRFGISLVTVYGLTEDPMPVLAPRNGFSAQEDHRVRSSGRPVDPSRHKIRIVGVDGETLPPGEVGEIVKRSPATMRGYFKDPEATAKVLQDGWLKTGDLGYLDEDGYLFFVGREKDAIRRSGEMIAAAQVEEALASHEAVAEVAVVGVLDTIRSEEIKACIVLRNGLSIDDAPPSAIFEHCTRHLAHFKVPRYLEYLGQLPRTATLKVMKRQLSEVPGVLGGKLFDRQQDGWIQS